MLSDVTPCRFFLTTRGDRHEHIGLGKIGLTGLRHFIQSRLFSTIPLILETPKKQESDDPRNLRTVRKMLRLKR